MIEQLIDLCFIVIVLVTCYGAGYASGRADTITRACNYVTNRVDAAYLRRWLERQY